MGWSDFGARIVMGFGTTGTLLTHEVGHAMSLAHPEDGPTRASSTHRTS